MSYKPANANGQATMANSEPVVIASNQTAIPISKTDGADVTLGAKADAKSTATDTTAISIMSVLKQVSASVQAAAASLAGTLTVASHAVTNAGTFAVQATEADGANVTLGAKADAKSTATDTTAVTIMQVLKQISASVQAPPSQAVTNAGTFAVQAAIADGANVTLGAKADAKSTATDTTAITIMQVLKQISASVQAPPSQAVTNAGTFLVQENGPWIQADDAAFTPATSKVAMVGAEFDDTSPDSVDEGDGGAIRMSANRNLYVRIRDNAGNERGLNIDANGALAATVTNATAANLKVEATIAAAQTLATVTTVTTVSTVSALGVGTTGPQKAEDVAFANGDMGLAVWTVRQDTLATTAANGDYVPFSSDSIGALYTRDTATLVDDATFTPATSRVLPVGFMVDDTATDSVNEGDIGAPRMSADRIQYVQGALAHDAVDANNPVKVGGQARTTNPTAVADADRANFITDKLGKQVVVGSIRDLKANQVTTITSSTTETTIVTAVASTFMDLYGLIITNTSATAVNVAIKDSTAGTTQLNIAVPAGDTRGFMLNESAAIKQGTVNNNWTATSSASVSSLVITALCVKNT